MVGDNKTIQDGTHLSIKFDADDYSIRSSSLIGSLIGFGGLIQKIGHENGVSNIDIRVVATKRSSFDLIVTISNFVEANPILMAIIMGAGGKVGETIISQLGEFLNLRKKIGTDKIKKIKNSGDGNFIVNGDIKISEQTYNIYNNPKAHRDIEGIFNPLNKDDSIGKNGVDVAIVKNGDRQQVFSAKRNEFAKLSQRSEILDSEAKIVRKTNQSLMVIKVVFEKNRKWDFIYEGNKISCDISEDVFEKLKKKSFAASAIIYADLEITQIKDDDTGIVINKSYKLIKYYSH